MKKKQAISFWWYWLFGNVTGLAIFDFYGFNDILPSSNHPHQFVITILVLTTTGLAAIPLFRFMRSGWDARQHEFRNRLNNEALIAYLQQFWERRTIKYHDSQSKFNGWLVKDYANEDALINFMDKVFDIIYQEQFGRKAFVAPMILLFAVIFMMTVLCILIYTKFITLEFGIEANNVAIASIIGAYMYVVMDSIQNVRQRSLNASSLCWYVLRLLLAIPIGIALTYPETISANAKPIVAFGIGTLPVDEIYKLLRQQTRKFLEPNKENSPEESDQLIKLEGVTSRIASILIAEGVDSIGQIITVDPVLLSIRTGLPFKFILHLGSQAIARRYLGDNVDKLTSLGLSNAKTIDALVADLANGDNDTKQKAQSTLTKASSLLSEVDSECLEFIFRQIATDNYSHFILGRLLTMDSMPNE